MSEVALWIRRLKSRISAFIFQRYGFNKYIFY